ncbi:hypothetical protein C8R44DRAFT_856061, partial [Mycena epipterygia]
MKLILFSRAQLVLLFIVPAVLAHPIQLAHGELDTPMHPDLSRRSGNIANEAQHLPFRNYPSENDEEDAEDLPGRDSDKEDTSEHLPFRSYPSEKDDEDAEDLPPGDGQEEDGPGSAIKPQHLPFRNYPSEKDDEDAAQIFRRFHTLQPVENSKVPASITRKRPS